MGLFGKSKEERFDERSKEIVEALRKDPSGNTLPPSEGLSKEAKKLLEKAAKERENKQ